MSYQITVRHGTKIHRYLTFPVEASTAVEALREAADRIPIEVAPEVDLVELRSAPQAESREGNVDLLQTGS